MWMMFFTHNTFLDPTFIPSLILEAKLTFIIGAVVFHRKLVLQGVNILRTKATRQQYWQQIMYSRLLQKVESEDGRFDELQDKLAAINVNFTVKSMDEHVHIH